MRKETYLIKVRLDFVPFKAGHFSMRLSEGANLNFKNNMSKFAVLFNIKKASVTAWQPDLSCRISRP